MYNKIMHDKIRLALKDERNGSIQAIYARIRKYGTPFKTGDKRIKYTDNMVRQNPYNISKQTVFWRIKHGWTIEKATTTPARKRKANDKNIRENISDSVLA